MIRTLTELESCVLGAIWQRGPCTAYTIRREFADSVTPYWSASAGSIYPVVARLARLRLIEAERTRWGERTRARYAITAAGLAVLRSWIGPPIPPEAIAPAFDPLRTRASYLGALSDAQRKRFVDRALADTRQALANARERFAHEPPLDRFEALATSGVLDELQARLAWLTRLARELAPRARRA
jgi:DNA-binding PadR family transcriptional regulator